MTGVQFDFEELTPVILGKVAKGMMLYGTATLESADPGEPHSFFVSSIELDGGIVLTADGGVPRGHHSLSKDLFKAISEIIENDRHPLGRAAQDEFSEAVDGEREGDPDAARDERRDRFMGEIPAITTARRPDMSRKSRAEVV